MPQPALSQQLREASTPSWAPFRHHRFFQQYAEGTLPEAAVEAYFANEYHFVREAVPIFAYLLTRANTLEARRHLVGVLHGLVHEQVDFFEDQLVGGGLPRERLVPATFPAEVTRMGREFAAAARVGTYAEGIASVWVAEQTYLEVSSELAAIPSRFPALAAWFQLHTDTVFTHGVGWLRAELDRIGREGTTPAELLPAVEHALLLETEFHDAALAGPTSREIA